MAVAVAGGGRVGFGQGGEPAGSSRRAAHRGVAEHPPVGAGRAFD